MNSFTPLTAALGGTLVGLAAAVLWLGNGRIAGISGIFGNLLPPAHTTLWRAVFLVALVAATWLTARAFPQLGVGGALPAELVAPPAGWSVPMPVWLVIAGLLTGLGTRIGNGCTSGHGVCGLARLSPRSMVAVAIFFGVAIFTVAVTGIV
ncbi:YeeE/YedE family protein [Devosia aurantiaca]|uniref:YeeE/YedE family protein n=1 Tax=Devosia aurantiaca TaxID=2714858 RepID=A0A6M1SXQ7_9HYPH|nr:YeeE/YedE family protein [Devosia aurantiaca]NGP17551.1 YeeE/YedE family protein [Devosia aurantiaca]